MRLSIYIPDYLYDVLNDEETQKLIYGKLYDYMKKYNKINMSLTIRTLIISYLEEHGYMDRRVQ